MANLLIVDGDPTIREVICFTLRDSGLRFLQAEDGHKALEMLEKEPVHAVLTDREVAGKDGLEILKEIQKLKRSVPVIFMVSLDDEDHDRLLDAGAFATLKKPFSVEEMKRIVAQAVPESVISILNKSEKDKEQARIKRKKRKAALVSSVLLLAAAAGALWHFFKPAPLTLCVPVPYSHPSGLAFDGSLVWACDWFTESVYQHSGGSDLGLLKTFKFEDMPLSGLAWDGKNLWGISSWNKKLYKFSAGLEPKVEKEIPSPFAQPAGLSVDPEGNFWTCDSSDGKIARFVEKGDKIEVLWSAKGPAQKPVGVFKAGKFLWTADAKTGLLYRQKTESFEKSEPFALPPDVEQGRLAAFGWNGESFFAGMDGSNKIYKIHPRRLLKAAQ